MKVRPEFMRLQEKFDIDVRYPSKQLDVVFCKYQKKVGIREELEISLEST
jgi:hypothetical protein